MLIEVKVPQLSESVSEATLLSWRKQEGEYAERGENLIDIETDKVVLELPAIQSGVLSQILKEEGAVVMSGEIIGMLDTDAAKPEAAKKPEAPILMPAAKKLAEEIGADIAQIAGTGRGGRIIKEDVVSHRPVERTARRVPMSRLRATVAQRLLESQRNAAILTTFNEVDMKAVVDMRNRHRERFEKDHGVKLGFMSFFVKAVVCALNKFPVLNAAIEGDDIVYHDYHDIGIAVGTPRGLVVPVLRNADSLSFEAIEKGIADFGKRAQDGKLALSELEGGTFSITNGGIFGSMLSTPILNPPQSAILGIHAMKERPMAENGQVVIRPMIYLALSYDHRLIDGREAVLALVAIKESLEDPARLLLEM
ncbi:MAG: dihydrolipoyllysine-residue succinyltransferase [Burkholderiales bacterium]|nr:dihydrolipoyllysine-residue succinyltransferase [Burkholderiales bacterium]